MNQKENFTKYIKGAILVFGILFSAQLFSQTPDLTGYKVMVNPGHGGHDSDDRGMTNGFWESGSNLTKGLWLRDILEARGCEVVMSRVENNTEDDLPLSQIAAMANTNEVDLFISIHSNAGNQVSNYPMPIFNGKTETPTIPASKVFAQILGDQLIKNQATFWTRQTPKVIGDLTLNPSWHSGYGVLWPLVVPGIISEGSFHDYKPEVGRLLSVDYRKQEAWNMYYAIVDFFELDGKESLGQITGIIRDSLLVDEFYTLANSPDKYFVVKSAKVELLETGEIYEVGDTAHAEWVFNGNNAPVDKEVNFNAGFYYFDSLPAGNYHLVFSGKDYFTDTVEIEVKGHEFSYQNYWLEADKTIPPKLVSTDPSDGETIECFDPIKFTFNMNMDSASFSEALIISPKLVGKNSNNIDGLSPDFSSNSDFKTSSSTIAGSFKWDKDYLNVWFQPDIPYDIETEYEVFIDSTVKHQWGVNMDTTITFSFITGNRNRYLVENSFPAVEQVDVSPYLQFRVVFDAPIKNSSLINAVSIIKDDGTEISTKGAIITIVDNKGHYYFEAAENLEYNTEYTLKLAGTIKDETNIPMVDDVEIKFTTHKEFVNVKVLADFEEADDWSLDYENSNEIDNTSFIYSWKKSEMDGDASLLLRYKFLGNAGTAIIQSVVDIAIYQESDTVGIWVFGEMSNNDLYLIFDNSIEKHLAQIDFAGWRYCTVVVPESAVLVTGIKLAQKGEGAAGGDLLFDMLSQPGVITNVASTNDIDISIYPNPIQNGEINISGLSNVKTVYSIYDATGRLLQSGIVSANNRIILNNNILNNNLLIIKLSGDGLNKSLLLLNK